MSSGSRGSPARGARRWSAATPTMRRSCLAEALALWRGPPLADLAYESFAQNEIARLEEGRLVAIEDRIDADLALRRHEALIAELERLIADHPTRERLRAQLMLALYRSGRQAEALETYREARRELDRELGLEPGPELQELERAILNQDPAIAAPPRRGSLADLRTRRRGALAIAFGGGLLLAAAVAAILAGGDGDPDLAEPNTLAVIDPESGELVDTIPTGVQPVAVATDGTDVWVANAVDDNLTRIDADERAVVGTVPAEVSIGGIAAGDRSLWIASSRAWKLIRLDPTLGARQTTRLAALPDEFSSGTANPVTVGSDSVWVGRSAGGLARVDGKRGRVIEKIAVGNSPSAIDAGAGGIWLADDADNTVLRIDPRTAGAVTATTPVGQAPQAIAVGEGAVWVANTDDGTVTRLDPETAAVTATIAVGSRPTGIAIGAGSVWVANSLDGTVSRIDAEANEVEATLSVGEAPQAVAFANGLVWVSVQASAEPPAAPASGDEAEAIRVLVQDDPGATDPQLASSYDDIQRLGATCALLYNYPDRPLPVGAHLQPEVATGPPEISDGGRRYVFTLRDDFRFSPPSDEPVTAEAFARAFERALDPAINSYGATIARDIVGARAYRKGDASGIAGLSADGQTLTIELEHPVPNFVERLSTPWFCSVPPDTPVREEGVDLVPSAGPYYVASHDPNRSLLLRRNPNYGGDRPQGVEEIHYEIGVSPERGAVEVEEGRADYVLLDPTDFDTPPDDLIARLTAEYGPDSEAASAGSQQLFAQPSLSLYYFVFNADSPAFTDPDVRRAVAFAIDRRALARYTGVGETGQPTDQLLPPGIPGYEDEAIYPLDGPDLETARRLAGTARRDAVLYTCDLPECTRHAQILRSNLAAIGIDLDVRLFPLGEFFERIYTPGEPWDIAYTNWFVDHPDPANYINDLFGEGGEVLGAVHDRELERRMDEAVLLSGDPRYEAYAELDRDLPPTSCRR